MTENQTIHIQKKMSKEEINNLPLFSYGGPLHVIRSVHEVPPAVSVLRKEPLLGFDTETRPSFRKGEVYQPSLLQLATSKAVYIFQLKLTGLTPKMIALLSNPDIIKAGVAIRRDIKELQDITPFDPHGFIDLGDQAKAAGLQHHGLRGLAAVLLGGRISKGAQLTNWSRTDLPEQALRYAATDAWIGRKIYESFAQRGNDSLN